MKITVYQPVCSAKGDKKWFTVNGAISPDREEAIRLANNHACFKYGIGKIERIDEYQVDEYDWYNPKTY